MEEDLLTRELLKRIFGNLGAVPGDNFGKVGITTPIYLLNKTITLLDENGNKEKYSVWAGEIIEGGETYKIILTNLGTKTEPEFVSIFYSTAAFPLSFRLVLDKCDIGSFALRHGKGWTEINMGYKLNLASAIELLTQEGRVWSPCKETDELFDLLLGIIE